VAPLSQPLNERSLSRGNLKARALSLRAGCTGTEESPVNGTFGVCGAAEIEIRAKLNDFERRAVAAAAR
jgi:hypothetical protein